MGIQPCDSAVVQVTADMALRGVISAGPLRTCALGAVSECAWWGHHVQHLGTGSALLLMSRCILLSLGLGRLKSQGPLTCSLFAVVPQGPLFDAAVRN